VHIFDNISFVVYGKITGQVQAEWVHWIQIPDRLYIQNLRQGMLQGLQSQKARLEDQQLGYPFCSKKLVRVLWEILQFQNSEVENNQSPHSLCSRTLRSIPPAVDKNTLYVNVCATK